MRKKILDYYGGINATFLHAHSEAGTEFLSKELAPINSETILEIGIGTGGTLVKIKSRYPSIQLVGIDKSPTMCQKSTARLSFCGIKNVQVFELSDKANFQFKDATFDKVYVESVLAIQDGITLEFMLREACRVLKPGGRLILNETIWLPEIVFEEISQINKVCREAFGIVQSNQEYPNHKAWEDLILKVGFAQVNSKVITPIKKKHPLNKQEILSKVFTLMGKIRAYQPKLKRELHEYEKSMKSIYKNKKYMEGYLFVADK